MNLLMMPNFSFFCGFTYRYSGYLFLIITFLKLGDTRDSVTLDFCPVRPIANQTVA